MTTEHVKAMREISRRLQFSGGLTAVALKRLGNELDALASKIEAEGSGQWQEWLKEGETPMEMIAAGRGEKLIRAVRSMLDNNKQDDTGGFKNFHRSLCERFGYTHDEVHWRRDQVSLEEHIAKLTEQAKASEASALQAQPAMAARETFEPAKIPDGMVDKVVGFMQAGMNAGCNASDVRAIWKLVLSQIAPDIAALYAAPPPAQDIPAWAWREAIARYEGMDGIVGFGVTLDCIERRAKEIAGGEASNG